MEEIKKEDNIVIPKRDEATGKNWSTLRRYDVFAEAYLDFTSATYRNGTKSAIKAGYKAVNANTLASKLLKEPYIQKKLKEIEIEQKSEHEVTVEWIKSEYVKLYNTCLSEKDRSNAKSCLSDLGKMLGAFVDVQRTELYDGRLDSITQDEEKALEDVAKQFKIRLAAG